ncbi:MAG TPA: type II toxin-antitoxin system RelE/ParE family toxin [Tepidiformaceae bacterium]|nr:type II toxin-antitoxin system RelE/ParE family toxin [Tepidiformaceae bacterium]
MGSIDHATSRSSRTLFPTCGRIIPELENEQVRELILGDYRLWYWIDGEQIEILGVFCGRQSLDP